MKQSTSPRVLDRALVDGAGDARHGRAAQRRHRIGGIRDERIGAIFAGLVREAAVARGGVRAPVAAQVERALASWRRAASCAASRQPAPRTNTRAGRSRVARAPTACATNRSTRARDHGERRAFRARAPRAAAARRPRARTAARARRPRAPRCARRSPRSRRRRRGTSTRTSRSRTARAAAIPAARACARATTRRARGARSSRGSAASSRSATRSHSPSGRWRAARARSSAPGS